MSEMNPAEAAEWVEQSAPIHITAKAPAVRILIDHARATAAPDDLAALAATRELTDDELRNLGRSIAETLDRAAAFGRDEAIDHANSDSDAADMLSTLARELRRYGWVMDQRLLLALAPLATAHRSAPAVEVTTPPPVAYDEHERVVMDQIAEADRAAEWADKLAAALAPSTVVGEHSSANDPWANALAYAGGPWGSPGARYGPAAPPAEPDRRVDLLGQAFVGGWTFLGDVERERIRTDLRRFLTQLDAAR